MVEEDSVMLISTALSSTVNSNGDMIIPVPFYNRAR
jgi:hypothetical protein